ncbi:type I glyceraldehyde-3-phosphate dehydrogenase [Marinitenerispora sediminis]|uniref:Type I glyceraldehyde-3-phosphate dehydrogenase n=1 Tax=Marinitenerispora sediminis TaxID=1931232 RepID=A0A368T2J0_9ACTN|nr:type I glyceraldehyde-3-phosphate dehydrogenase [Marinitenerispora sediminis]RCV49155.1 type I glyceraldehyde-3-phosphate dehydrogenase [Marinitenerispora sediminis]RCV55938.1 type I glyceraldehyde-3-phosphate dehydrogenase [Marinitenerispora sediminis]RCV60403.1 type I glyceraldehyde-3-phosphate dehydrogenase [Marinitenerispora sediminis]
MTVRIGINGFGRIGRSYLRAALRSGADIEVVAINDIADATTLATLLEWDSITGHLDGVHVDGDVIVLQDARIRVTSEREPARIPWGEERVDVVIESTGRFTNSASARQHLVAGARKVIISAPADSEVPALVLGVNDDTIDMTGDVFSNGSCTTNCFALMVKVLHEAFGIESGLMTTVHAYTSDQRLHDAPHSDLRRARAAALSTIPTSSGAAGTIGRIVPELDGKLTAVSLRVPVPVGSITDFTAKLSRPATVEQVNAAFRTAAEAPELRPYLAYSEAPLVSTDIVGDPHSAIFDAPLTQVVGDQVKVFAWYDNEWGFSNRLVELSQRVGS